MSGLKVVYAGTPEFAVPSLLALLQAGFDIVGVYTQPDRPAGRGRKLKPSPVKRCAEEHNLLIFQPKSLKSEEEQARLAELKPDVMIVAAYGLILPQAVLDIPRLGCVNVHASLLPRWRGAAPITRALLAGDTETGITIMQMDAGLDTGAMLAKVVCPITETDTSASLEETLAQQGGDLLVQTLQNLEQAQAAAQIQDDALACYAEKLTKQEGEIDWSRSAVEIARQVRAFNPRPVAFTQQNDDTLRLWDAKALDESCTQPPGTIVAVDKKSLHVATGAGLLSILQMQLPGKKAMPVQAILNSQAERFAVGNTLG